MADDILVQILIIVFWSVLAIGSAIYYDNYSGAIIVFLLIFITLQVVKKLLRLDKLGIRFGRRQMRLSAERRKGNAVKLILTMIHMLLRKMRWLLATNNQIHLGICIEVTTRESG